MICLDKEIFDKTKETFVYCAVRNLRLARLSTTVLLPPVLVYLITDLHSNLCHARSPILLLSRNLFQICYHLIRQTRHCQQIAGIALETLLTARWQHCSAALRYNGISCQSPIWVFICHSSEISDDQASEFNVLFPQNIK